MSEIKYVFNMTWLMEILKIEPEEQLLIKYCVIKHLILLKIRNMIHINVDLLQWSINVLIKTLLEVVLKMKICQTSNYQKNYTNKLLEFEKRKVRSTFIDNIWSADLADIQLISKFNKEFRFSLCVIDIYNKYAWVITLKDKKGITVTNPFQKNLDEPKRKPNKIWVNKGSKFYNRSMKSWLEKNL